MLVELPNTLRVGNFRTGDLVDLDESTLAWLKRDRDLAFTTPKEREVDGETVKFFSAEVVESAPLTDVELAEELTIRCPANLRIGAARPGEPVTLSRGQIESLRSSGIVLDLDALVLSAAVEAEAEAAEGSGQPTGSDAPPGGSGKPDGSQAGEQPAPKRTPTPKK